VRNQKQYGRATLIRHSAPIDHKPLLGAPFRGKMRATLIKRSLWAVVGMLVVALAAVLITPMIASKMIGGTHIVEVLSERTGLRVAVVRAPEIKIWPRLSVVLHDVAFREKTADATTILSAQEMDVDLSTWASLMGRVEPSAIRFSRPQLSLAWRDGRYRLPESTTTKRLEQAITEMSATDDLDPTSIGRISFSDGRLVDIADGDEIASALNGAFEWLNSSGPAFLKSTAVWRDEPVSISLSVAAPAALLRDEASNLAISIGSDKASINFNGTASGLSPPVFDGALDASTPDVEAALTWLDINIGPGFNLGKLSIVGPAKGTIDRLSLGQAAVVAGDMDGSGALEFSLVNGIPNVAGTLAFDRLDLEPILKPFNGENGHRATDLEFTRQFGIDLRLSAAESSAFGQTMMDVAATVQVRPEFAAFDISDATTLGGTMQLGFRGVHKQQGDTGELRLTLTDADVAPLLSLLGLNGELIAAKTALRRLPSSTRDGAEPREAKSLVDDGRQSARCGVFRLGATMPISTTVQAALISGVTPSRTWL
jgi:AsmA protein